MKVTGLQRCAEFTLTNLALPPRPRQPGAASIGTPAPPRSGVLQRGDRRERGPCRSAACGAQMHPRGTLRRPHAEQNDSRFYEIHSDDHIWNFSTSLTNSIKFLRFFR